MSTGSLLFITVAFLLSPAVSTSSTSLPLCTILTGTGSRVTPGSGPVRSLPTLFLPSSPVQIFSKICNRIARLSACLMGHTIANEDKCMVEDWGDLVDHRALPSIWPPHHTHPQHAVHHLNPTACQQTVNRMPAFHDNASATLMIAVPVFRDLQTAWRTPGEGGKKKLRRLRPALTSLRVSRQWRPDPASAPRSPWQSGWRPPGRMARSTSELHEPLGQSCL